MPSLTINLILEDGSAFGKITAKIPFWNGSLIIVTPKTPLTYDEASLSGILLSVNKARQVIDIELFSNLQQKMRNISSEWSKLIAITTSDGSLDGRSEEYVLNALKKKYLMNFRDVKVPEHEKVSLNDFCQKVELVVGLYVDEPQYSSARIQTKPAFELQKPQEVSHTSTDLVFEYRIHGALARMIHFSGKKVKVLKDSTGIFEPKDSMLDSARDEKQKLFNEGKIIHHLTRRDLFLFVEDIIFNSPSLAGMVVSGTSVNGKLVWTLPDGKTYGHIFG